jgi:hypothetical protein
MSRMRMDARRRFAFCITVAKNVGIKRGSFPGKNFRMALKEGLLREWFGNAGGSAGCIFC